MDVKKAAAAERDYIVSVRREFHRQTARAVCLNDNGGRLAAEEAHGLLPRRRACRNSARHSALRRNWISSAFRTRA